MTEARVPVLYFLNSVVRGGAEEHLLALLQSLDRERFRLGLAGPPELLQSLERDLPADVARYPVLLRGPLNMSGFIGLARIIRQFRPAVFHSHLFYASLFGAPVAWFCRVPVILETTHIREHWRHGWKSSFRIDRLVGRVVSGYIAVSEANARYLVGEKRLPASKVRVIQNGCRLDRSHPAGPSPAAMRASLGFGEDDPVLLHIGRLETQKGHRVLLEALPAVRARFPAVRLVCAGEGSLRGELEKQVAAGGLGECVRFAGYQPDVAAWLALASMAVLPSFYEGLPLAAIESLAAGRPVVATAVDGTPEVVVDGETGLLVPPGDAGSLARAIVALLESAELRQRMGQAGRRHVLQHFTLQRQVEQTAEFYVSLLAACGRSCEQAGSMNAAPRAPIKAGAAPRKAG